jgi:sulfur carrier protein ThiS
MVTLLYRGKEYTVTPGMTLRDALKKIGLSPESILAVYEGQLVTDDFILKPEMTLKLVAVISGGSPAAPISPAGPGSPAAGGVPPARSPA